MSTSGPEERTAYDFKAEDKGSVAFRNANDQTEDYSVIDNDDRCGSVNSHIGPFRITSGTKSSL
jgi:hypothetical protein